MSCTKHVEQFLDQVRQTFSTVVEKFEQFAPIVVIGGMLSACARYGSLAARAGLVTLQPEVAAAAGAVGCALAAAGSVRLHDYYNQLPEPDFPVR